MGYKAIKHEGPETLTSLDFQTSNTPAIVISLFVSPPPTKNDKTHVKTSVQHLQPPHMLTNIIVVNIFC